jgi:hypothetical protein
MDVNKLAQIVYKHVDEKCINIYTNDNNAKIPEHIWLKGPNVFWHKTRIRKVSFGRFIMMYVMRKAGMPYNEIAKIFRVDRTSIYHAIGEIEKYSTYDCIERDTINAVLSDDVVDNFFQTCKPRLSAYELRTLQLCENVVKYYQEKVGCNGNADPSLNALYNLAKQIKNDAKSVF